jgi:hypothetical protein
MTGMAGTNRRRGAPIGNRNAFKSGLYTAEAKAQRKRRRLLLRQLRAGLAYMRAVIRARAAAVKISKIEKQFPGGRMPAAGDACHLRRIRPYYVPEGAGRANVSLTRPGPKGSNRTEFHPGRSVSSTDSPPVPDIYGVRAQSAAGRSVSSTLRPSGLRVAGHPLSQ